MGTLLWTVGQLVLVAVVYIFAYKNGYKAAYARAASTVQEFSEPVNELLYKLRQTVDQSLKSQNEKSSMGRWEQDC